jgi:hypothetical protein
MAVSPIQYEGIKEIELDLNVSVELKSVEVFVDHYFYEMAREDCLRFVSKMYPTYMIMVKHL